MTDRTTHYNQFATAAMQALIHYETAINGERSEVIWLSNPEGRQARKNLAEVAFNIADAMDAEGRQRERTKGTKDEQYVAS